MTTDAFSKVNALTQEQRDAAYDAARRRIAGPEPQLADFERSALAKYPPDVVKWINRMADVVMAAAFVPSALRIFMVSGATFSVGVASPTLAFIVALTSVLLAEIGQVVFTVAAGTSEGRGTRLALWTGAAACTAYALIGNAQVAQPWTHGFAFGWLEAFAPPVLVLIAANVRKTQVLRSVAERHAAHQAYASAVAAWTQAYDAAEQHAAWGRTLANALRDALRFANRGSKAVLRQLTEADWYALTERERTAEEWYERASQPASVAQTQPSTQPERETSVMPAAPAQRSGTSNTGATGEVQATEMIERDGGYVRRCPICDWETEPKPTQRSATNSLVAHMKTHAAERNAAPVIDAVAAMQSAIVNATSAPSTNGHHQERI